MRTIPINKFEDYLLTKRLSERTIQEYIYYFNKFDEYDLTQDRIGEFLSEKRNRNPVARSFIKNLLEFIRINFKDLGYSKEDIIDISLIETPKITGRTKKRIIEVISIEQIYNLEKEMRTERLKLMLLVCFFGALRVKELIRLQVKDFDWSTWCNQYNQGNKKVLRVKIKGKGNKEDIVFIPYEVAKRLYNYITKNKFKDTSEYIFYKGEDVDNLNKIKSKSVIWNRELKRCAKRIGMEEDLHSHLLRHSLSNYLLNVKKLEIRKVQEFLRHSSITSTQIYTQINKEDLQKSIEEIF